MTKLYVTKLCVCVWQFCVCVCVSELCLTMFYLTKSCLRMLFVTKVCVVMLHVMFNVVHDYVEQVCVCGTSKQK